VNNWQENLNFASKVLDEQAKEIERLRKEIERLQTDFVLHLINAERLERERCLAAVDVEDELSDFSPADEAKVELLSDQIGILELLRQTVRTKKGNIRKRIMNL